MKKFSRFLIALLAILSFAVNASETQIHIKARFLEVSEKEFQDFVTPNLFANFSAKSGTNGWVELLTDEKFKSVLRALEAESGIETLAEPEVITTSGRQTQMRGTTTKVEEDVVYDVVVEKPLNPLGIGPSLDVVPYVLSDGYTINLTLIPSLTELLASSNSVPKSLPDFRVRQVVTTLYLWDGQTSARHFIVNRSVVTTLNLWDGQTAIISGLPEKDYVNGKKVTDKSKASDKELLIFITATIVDAAGNRIHSDEELSFAQNGVPPQPK